ncbi:AMP-binding protein [Nocardioides dilutus]
MRPTGTTRDVVGAVRPWLAADDEEPVVVETSGSSGEPKRVVLSRSAVLASVHATERRLGGSGRWLLALPPTYVAGLQVIVRSLVAGRPPTLLEEHGSVASAVATHDLDFVSLVPTQLHRMLEDTAETAALRTFRTVLLGGGPIEPGLRERAAVAGISVVATYGSAETAGGCVYDGVALDGVGLAVDGDGRLRIAGPMLFDRYDGDPGLTARTLVDGWFLTSDAARIDDDGRLQVLGRLDDMVVTGGVNVPAPAVARRLRDHPAVTEAEVLGVPDPEWGSRLVAFVVGAIDLDEARGWVAEAHPRSWAPRQLVLVDAIPLLANGKPDRIRLRGLA